MWSLACRTTDYSATTDGDVHVPAGTCAGVAGCGRPLLASTGVVRDGVLPVAAGRASAAGGAAIAPRAAGPCNGCARGGAAPPPRWQVLGGRTGGAVRSRYGVVRAARDATGAGGPVGVGGGRCGGRRVRALSTRGRRLRW